MANLYFTAAKNGAITLDKFGAGKHGASDGNPGQFQDGSIVLAEWINGVTGEIMRAIEDSNQTPSESNFSQLSTAIQRCGMGFYGNGADGAGVWNSNMTLDRDWHYSTLQVSNNAVVDLNGFRIYVRDTLTIDNGCTLRCNGVAGSNGIAGGAGGGSPSNTTAGGLVGGAGGSGAGAGQPGALGGSSTASGGGAGGAGGAANGGAAPGGGGSATVTATYGKIGRIPVCLDGELRSPTSLAFINGGAGGGGGGGAAGVVGGGGGGGGGLVLIAARLLVHNGVLAANGGVGGQGEGNAGGGGGGGGGLVLLTYRHRSGAGTIQTNGGGGGTSAGAGASGVAGAAGNTIEVLA